MTVALCDPLAWADAPVLHDLAAIQARIPQRHEMGLHLVRPWPPGRASGVTLHLYSLPYDDCNCYCPETGQVTRRRLGHYSVRGRILPAIAST